MLAMKDDQLPIAQEASMTSSSGSQEHSFGSRSALPILAKEFEPVFYRNPNITHVNPAITLDSAYRTHDIQLATTSLSEITETDEKPSSIFKSSNSVSKDKELGMFSPDSPRQSRVVFKETMIFWYTGLLGDIRLQTKSKVIDGASNVHIVDKRFDFEESIIIFRPFLVKNQYELHFVNRCGHISRTLSTDCVVEFDAPVFGMCRSGDIRGLRDAFYSGSVSFNVVDPYGNGLLHYAASSLQKDLCSWLLDMGAGADRISDVGKALTLMARHSKIDQTSAATKTMIEIARLLAQAQEDFSAFDMSLWFRDYRGPPEGADFILSQDLAQDYICSADVSDQTYPVLAAILRLYAEDSEPWDPVIRTLIRRGADVHAPVHRYLRHLDQSEYLCPLAQYGTPLDELFMETLDPLEGQAAADGWLQILASEGHDILAYLKTESALHVKPIQLTHPSYQRLEEDDNERKLVFDFGACPSVSWDWWISPSSPASLLREEFKFMAITPPNGWLLYFWKDAWPI